MTPTSQPTPPRSDLLLRILLARRTGLADVRVLIDEQRTTYLQALRHLHRLADEAAGDPVELLLVEGLANLKAHVEGPTGQEP